MKKYIVYILIAMSFLGMSCMKDMTNMDVTPVDRIVIDTTGLGVKGYSKFLGDSLKLQIKVTKTGLSSENLKYEWGINAFGGYKRIVGTGKNLATKITEVPGQYTLVYTVTDTTTDQKAFFTWPLNVNSNFGNGLIVADTRDGITSDLNLLMCYNFTEAIWDDTEFYIYRNLYSDANGQKINGIVKSVSYMKYQNDRILTGITDNAIIRVNPLDYKFKDRDNQCFLLPPEMVSPAKIQSIQVAPEHEYIVNNGLLHSRTQSTGQFGYRFPADNLDYSCSNICGLQNPGPPPAPAALLYDEKNNRFLLAPSIAATAASLATFPLVDNTGGSPAFDPRNIGNKTCLHLEEGQSSRVLAVMKDRSSAQYFVYQVKMAPPINGKMGHSVHDISNNLEINLAKYYTCSASENVLFYATDNRVYATTLLVGGGSSANLRYTVENGEKITGMQMFRNQGYMTLPNPTKPTDYNARLEYPAGNRLLILSTYNETTKNGKIITIPLQTVGVGGLVTDPKYITTFSGFGKITAFGFQNQ